MKTKYLRGAAYALGEHECKVTEIPGFSELCRSRKLLLTANVMGFGSYFASDDIYARAADSVRETLRITGIAAETVSHVLVCSSQFAGSFFERNRRLSTVLESNGLSPRVVRGITGCGCSDFLASIDLACIFVELGSAENVLVVALEAASCEERERVLNYAILSDAAVSVIVTNQRPVDDAGFEIVERAVVSSVCDIGKGMAVAGLSIDKPFASTVIGGGSLDLSKVTKVFGNNLFLPVKAGREAVAGFTRAQTFLDNVARTGHCLGCDSLIGLVDYGVRTPEGFRMLFAEAEGHVGYVLLNCVN
jgi:3-oxoacyl-[acyl-carrier-protein] synthase III